MRIYSQHFSAYLAPLRLDDADTIASNGNDPGIINENFGSVGHDYSIGDAVQFVEYAAAALAEKRAYILGVYPNKTSKLIGVAGINQIDQIAGIGDIGYWIAKDERRKGYATQGISMLMYLGFSGLLLNKLEARVSCYNAGSIALLDKLGFVQEARIRRSLVRENQLVDMLVYGMLSDEYKESQDVILEW